MWRKFQAMDTPTARTNPHLIAFRRRRNRTQDEQALRWGITAAQLSRLERGRIEASPKLVRRIYRESRGRLTPNHIFNLHGRCRCEGGGDE